MLRALTVTLNEDRRYSVAGYEGKGARVKWILRRHLNEKGTSSVRHSSDGILRYSTRVREGCE